MIFHIIKFLRLKDKIILKIINLILSFTSFEIKKKQLSENKILKKLIKKNNPIIFDIGAHEGQSIKKFIKIFPSPKIYAFEPQKKEYDKLKKNFLSLKSNLQIFNFAIGPRNFKKIFYENNRSQVSSFYPVKKNFNYENFPEINLKTKKNILLK